MDTTSVRRAIAGLAAASLGSLLFAPAPLAAGEPAGGAATEDLIPATIAAALLSIGAVAFGEAHRRGRTQALSRLAAFAGRVSGLPGWVALPSLMAAVALVTACFGFYWDVATHIDDGRDAGPLANTSHFFILAGLGGIVLSGYAAMLLGAGSERTRTSLELLEGWHAPLGGVLIFLCGVFAISGFPLDDVWHRLFGQDVTLWGPTHILMIGGASLSTLGIWVLLTEGRRARRAQGAAVPQTPSRAAEIVRRLRGPGVAGGFLIGLSTLQLEFNYGVPQFRLLFDPIMIALAAGIALVAARARLGRGGALAAAGFYVLLNGAITLLVGPVFGHTLMGFPLYLAEAALVELVALRVCAERPLTLGAVSGLLIGTVGLATEWGWSLLAMPIPWTAALFPEVAIAGPVAGLAGGLLGGFIARSLGSDRGAHQPAPRWLAPSAAAAAVSVLAFPLFTEPGAPVRAQVVLEEVRPAPDREVTASVRLDPAAGADGSEWMSVLAWQGGGSRLEHLRESAPGTYRTIRPLPVHGEWKAFVRLHDGRSLRALPIYMPRDTAIPAPEIPAEPAFARSFVPDKRILQREAVGSSALQLPAYGLLAGVAAVWLAAMTWGLTRLGRAGIDPKGGPPES
ncbi:MAG: hypothetical protein M3481_00790, partial [Actinomycetota bacterium]|nr:hypothetical protein [Actinomycetota bacterium]